MSYDEKKPLKHFGIENIPTKTLGVEISTCLKIKMSIFYTFSFKEVFFLTLEISFDLIQIFIYV